MWLAATSLSSFSAKLSNVGNRKNPCLCFWGVRDLNAYYVMEENLNSMGQSLKERPIFHIDELFGVFCVLKNEQWHRAHKLPEFGLSHAGPIRVININTGEVHHFPIASIRTLI